MKARVLCLSIAGAVLSAHPGSAQDRLEIRESSSTCLAGCFTLDTIATLRDDTGRIVALPYSVLKLADGTGYLVSHHSGPASIFDTTGAFVREVGRAGAGPHEYRFTYIVSGGNDSILIFDHRNARLTTLSPDGQYHSDRFVELPVLQALHLSGRTYVNATVPSFELAGLPIHRLADNGSFESSFGTAPDSPGSGPHMQLTGWRQLAAGPAPSIYAVYRPLYWIDEWSLDGGLLRSFRRVADWFPERVDRSDLRPGGEIRPALMGAQSTPGNRLVTFSHVAADGWEDALVERRGGRGNRRSWYVPSRYDAVFDSRVELLDLDSGHVVASETFDYALVAFVVGVDGEIFASAVDDLGAPEVLVLGLTVAEAIGGKRP